MPLEPPRAYVVFEEIPVDNSTLMHCFRDMTTPNSATAVARMRDICHDPTRQRFAWIESQYGDTLKLDYRRYIEHPEACGGHAMLTVATERGSVQWHRYEYVKVRRPANAQSETFQVGDLIDGHRIKLASGDAISVNDEWLTVQAVSWNAVWDRENEAERARKKADCESEKQRAIEAKARAAEDRITALAEKLLAKGLVKLHSTKG